MIKYTLSVRVGRFFGPAFMVAGLLAGAAHAQPSAAQGSESANKAMMAGMEKMKPTGDTDKDFAMMMKMHHQQALDMAKPQIQNGKSPELKAMARKIVKDQTKEIAQLDAWLKKHP